MKKRLGFVTNSSSTCYLIIRDKKVESAEDIKDITNKDSNVVLGEFKDQFDVNDNEELEYLASDLIGTRFFPYNKQAWQMEYGSDEETELIKKISDKICEIVSSGKFMYLASLDRDEEFCDRTFNTNHKDVFITNGE